MNHKHHCECKHVNLAYCKKCDTAYCMDCGKEWKNGKKLVPYYPHCLTITEPTKTWKHETMGSLMSSVEPIVGGDVSYKCLH